jgi:hypothetical protein
LAPPAQCLSSLADFPFEAWGLPALRVQPQNPPFEWPEVGRVKGRSPRDVLVMHTKLGSIAARD